MVGVISCSVTDSDRADLAQIKQEHNLGATQVLRVGIKSIIQQKHLQAEQLELRQTNQKLSEKLQNYAKRLWEMEQKLK